MFRLRLAALAGAAALLTPLAPATPAAHAATWLTFTGVRPGTLLVVGDVTVHPPAYDGLNGCTANFVFQDAPGPFDPAQQLYLGTAGHCVSVGDRVRALAVAPGPGTPVLVTVGTVVLDVDANDFALIAVDPALNSWISPSMAFWGGPTGAYTGSAQVVGTQVGHAAAVGGVAPRAGLVTPGGTGFTFNTVTAIGDSGSPVTTIDGLAVGELVALAGSSEYAWVASSGRSIGLMLSLSGKVLSTCPTRTPWPAPGCPPA